MSTPAKKAGSAKPEAVPTGADAVEGDAGQPDGAGEQEDAPLNRAERRAKGRGKSASQVPGGRGKLAAGGHGPAHAQRNWANRRSG